MSLMKSWCETIPLRGVVATAAISGLLFLVACGGDSSSSGPSDDGASDSEEIQSSSSSTKVESSSSVILSGDSHEESSSSLSSSSLKSVSSSSNRSSSSSSSEKAKSSSSVILSGDSHEESSSSSSSSLKKVSSSSKLLSSSSSSEKAKSSSSSKDEAESSSSSQGFSSSEKNSDGRSWDVPKDAYLNPEITYESIVDSRDGQTYKTVKIGNQVWMAENLNYADSAKTPSLKGKSWCYDNNPESCAMAGRLYTWAAAIDSVKLATDQENPRDCGYGKICTLPDTVYGICPDGWHLPTNAEWKTLFVEVGGCTLLEYNSYSSCPSAGKILKSQTGWRGDKGSDAYGFSAIQVGRRSAEGYFDYDETYFWSVVEDDGYKANYMAYGINLGYTYDFTGLDYHSKRSGVSVRCLKN